MHYTVTVYQDNKLIESHYFKYLFLAKIESYKLGLQFPEDVYDIRIEEV